MQTQRMGAIAHAGPRSATWRPRKAEIDPPRPTARNPAVRGKSERSAPRHAPGSDDKVARGVAGWGKVGYCVDHLTRPGWRGSSHSATSAQTRPGLMNGVSRAIRLLTRREEPAQRAGEIPSRLLGWSGSREGARALRGHLGPGLLRDMDRELPQQPEPGEPRAAHPHALFRGQLVRRRARLGRPGDTHRA